MPSPIDDIAEHLISAAHKRFGDPGDPGGDYIATVAGDTDVPAYFRAVARLATEPPSRELCRKLENSLNQDAAMVMNAGLDHLLTEAALPPEQRRVIEQIKALQAWSLVVQQAEDTALQDGFYDGLREAGQGR